jgi:hypothetical protein
MRFFYCKELFLQIADACINKSLILKGFQHGGKLEANENPSCGKGLRSGYICHPAYIATICRFGS